MNGLDLVARCYVCLVIHSVPFENCRFSEAMAWNITCPDSRKSKGYYFFFFIVMLTVYTVNNRLIMEGRPGKGTK